MKQLALTTLLAVILLACKKDTTSTSETNQLELTENYLCEVIEEYDYANDFSDKQYDWVYQLVIENDSVYFLEKAFPLSSYDIPSGVGTHTLVMGTGYTITLTVSDHFNHIEYYTDFQSQLSGPSFSTSIIGNRTSIAPSSSSISYAGFGGNYLLYQQVYENYNAIDVDTTAVAAISYTVGNPYISVDGVQRYLPNFYSHYSGQSQYAQVFERTNMEFFWSSDSLYYHYHKASGQTIQYEDTTHYHLQGHRL